MFWSKAMKYPALTMGIIMFSLFVTDAKTQSWWEKTKRRFVPSTCDALVDRIKSKAPESWDMSCPGTELLILKYELKTEEKDKKKVRVNAYKQVANIIVTFSQMANPETLEYLKNFKVLLTADKLQILAKTDGEAMVGFRKLKNKKEIADHLKLTVKIKEELK